VTDRETLDGVLILGAGLAGLSAALACAPRKAVVLSPEPLMMGCSSAWAQGGMAVAMSPDDDAELHALDTIAAGAGLVDADMARLLTREGPDAVRRLADLGAPFDRDSDGRFAQSLEAAHSRPRVARIKGDQAGRGIMQAVVDAVAAEPRIAFRQARALALLQDESGRVRGALIEQADGRRTELLADAVILATGGIGGLYAMTTTPAAVRGEGLALAALAGARIADPEFMQFHPTAIDLPDSGGLDPAPLATEALRGEGAKLIDTEGRPFMAAYHPQAELAPRDVVARAIHHQISQGRGAFLDCREAIGDHFPTEFPAVFAACMAAGIDPRIEPIPVAPAAHYHMGGVWTDADGRTSLKGLYAVGECAATGVHGANRLASNSLLEAAVFGTRAGLAVRGERAPDGPVLPVAAVAPELPEAALQTLRWAMSRDAGVLRDRAGLLRLLGEIDGLARRYGQALVLVAARMVATAALARTESRGGHFRSDYPNTDVLPRRTLTTLAELTLEPAE
jgi:L-aspartate oxidase